MADMRYRRLGRSGLVVSVVGLGCNNFGKVLGLDESRAVIDAAIDHGITLFDTADSYGRPDVGASERILGEVLQGRRDQVVLATKFGSDMGGANGPDWGARGSRRYVRKAVERSLRDLRTDHIDLYQLHKPDPATPIEETLAALTELVAEGKVRYIGCSNFDGWMLADADWTARDRGLERFVSLQNEYSLLERGIEAEVVGACERYGVGVLPYFPLASGLLTGKYKRGEEVPADSRYARWGLADTLTEERFDQVEKLQAFAAERSISLLDVAIGGLAAQPAVASVIAGATKPAQIAANAAAGAWEPSPGDLTALDAIVPPGRPA
jgi:aryl-alcohol dehydrogenase-like predicted oxidoreductase